MAGELTFSEMKAEVLDNVSKSSTARTKSLVTLDTMAGRYLNRAQTFVSRREDLLFAVATASTVASQKDYAMPSNIKTLYSIRVENGLQSNKLTVAMPWEFDKIVPKPNEVTTGQPDWYVPYKGDFELYRIPDTVYTLRMRYAYWPTKLTTSGQTSDFTYFDEVLIYYATAMVYFWLQEYADAKEWKTLAAEEYIAQITAERDAIPDWAPRSQGFSSQPPQTVGEYYNDPFIEDDGAIRSAI